MLPTSSFAEGIERHAFVETKDRHAGVTEQLGDNEGQMSRFTVTGRANPPSP
jgi:hypothetical protein